MTNPSVPPPSERIAVVVNGNAKNVTRDVIEMLDQIMLGGDLFVSRKIEEGPQIARAIAERGYGTVLTGGGDGTFTVMVTQVLRACRERGAPVPRFGLLRLGTGNSLAWVVGASKAKGERTGRGHPTPARGCGKPADAPGRGRRLPRPVLRFRHRCRGARRQGVHQEVDA